MIKMISAGLIGGGLLILIGYVVYFFLSSLHIPFYIRLAAAMVVMGVILLLVAVGWDRLRAARKEDFKEVEK